MPPLSPYDGIAQADWLAKTKELIEAHPLSMSELAEVVLATWESIFDSRIGTHRFQIGIHIFPKPQIMGFFLHELIPLELAARHPQEWRIDETAGEKDLVFIPDHGFSVEIKTSSHPTQIFGNRSYAQPAAQGQKSKAGFYLAVNFGKFSTESNRPRICGIRFGWLDHADWIAQRAATGQQARLPPVVYKTKLISILK